MAAATPAYVGVLVGDKVAWFRCSTILHPEVTETEVTMTLPAKLLAKRGLADRAQEAV